MCASTSEIKISSGDVLSDEFLDIKTNKLNRKSSAFCKYVNRVEKSDQFHPNYTMGTTWYR